MGRRKNKFTKAIHHLKSKQIDEKLDLLNEAIPTNNTSNIYVVEPDYIVQDPDEPDLEGEVDFTQDDPALNGRDTTGLFAEDGTILTIEPLDELGDNSFILGPMSAMWYAWGNFTTIGYIRQSDRRMVNLGRIDGRLGDWNGVSNFTSYGELTLVQAVWFRDTPKLNGADNDTPNYRAFYPGPPSNAPDQYGRYLCVITGTPKPTTRTPPPRRVPPVMGPFDPNLPPGSALPKRTVVKKAKQGGLKVKTVYHGTSKEGERGIRDGGFRTTKTGLVPNKVWVGDKPVAQKYAQGGYSSGSMAKNAPSQQSIMKLRIPQGSGVTVPGPFGKETAISKQTANVGAGLKPARVSSGVKAGTTIKVTGVSGGGSASSGVQPIEPWIGKTNPLQGYTYDYKSGKYKLANSYEFEKNQFISESTKKILKDLKKPYQLPEEKREKIKYRPRVIGSEPRIINDELMKKAEVPTSFVEPEERLWTKYNKMENARWSQERKNQVLDHLGGSDHAWEWLTETSKKKNKDIMYGNFGGDPTSVKVVRQEQIKGDNILFLVDENGRKETILQSELSIRIADEFDKEVFGKYFQEQETLQADKDPLFSKVRNRLKSQIDYPDKPSKLGYPDVPPPETINGWHPEYGSDKGYYNKLDPQSADAMPATGNPEIDAKVRRAKTLKRVLGKKA